MPQRRLLTLRYDDRAVLSIDMSRAPNDEPPTDFGQIQTPALNVISEEEVMRADRIANEYNYTKFIGMSVSIKRRKDFLTTYGLQTTEGQATNLLSVHNTPYYLPMHFLFDSYQPFPSASPGGPDEFDISALHYWPNKKTIRAGGNACFFRMRVPGTYKDGLLRSWSDFRVADSNLMKPLDIAQLYFSNDSTRVSTLPRVSLMRQYLLFIPNLPNFVPWSADPTVQGARVVMNFNYDIKIRFHFELLGFKTLVPE